MRPFAFVWNQQAALEDVSTQTESGRDQTIHFWTAEFRCCNSKWTTKTKESKILKIWFTTTSKMWHQPLCLWAELEHDTICIVIAERIYKRIKPAYEIWNAAANAFRRCVTTATWVDRGELFFFLHRCEFGATKLIHLPLCQVGTTTCSCKTTLDVLDAASLAFTCLASGQRFQRALFWA